MVENSRTRTLGDYAISTMQGYNSSIVRPTIKANNFEIKPALIKLIQQDQFFGNVLDDPNLHLYFFLQLCDTIRINGVSEDAIRLRLFPFSLKDKAKYWLQAQPQRSITSWIDLVNKFLIKYFPPSKSVKLRSEITSFVQQDGEYLYDAWERYKDLLRRCSHHCIPEWMQIQTFYNGMNVVTKTMVDAATGGSLNTKTVEIAQQLIEMMANSMYQSFSERHVPSKGEFEAKTLETLINQNQMKNQLLFEQLAALTQQINTFQAGTVKTSNLICDFCGGNHMNGACDPSWSYCQTSSSQPPIEPQFSKPLSKRMNEMEEALLQFIEVTQSNFKNQEESIKKLETQIEQILQQLAHRDEDRFSSNAIVNPRKQCHAVILRSGAEVSNLKDEEKKIAIKNAEEKAQDNLQRGKFTLLRKENLEDSNCTKPELQNSKQEKQKDDSVIREVLAVIRYQVDEEEGKKPVEYTKLLEVPPLLFFSMKLVFCWNFHFEPKNEVKHKLKGSAKIVIIAVTSILLAKSSYIL
ncbi:uncharacterized protein LOC113874281 [Abrus precatorius]|uniref:Uncharacterized protein LOC113874281 n=1 Tax=Abrus precatorius TaxID=3816 RepID=A0A8B8MK87_ABRPR|nr:uncharacterized protein LOC113874281 [Abrus precatorius]